MHSIDPDMITCFGGSFGQFITKYFLGYDMMVISSFKGLLPSNHGKRLNVHNNSHTFALPHIASGYVKNLLTGSQYYYKVQWMGKWRYGAGLLPALFFVSTVFNKDAYYLTTHFVVDTSCISAAEKNPLSCFQISK